MTSHATSIARNRFPSPLQAAFLQSWPLLQLHYCTGIRFPSILQGCAPFEDADYSIKSQAFDFFTDAIPSYYRDCKEATSIRASSKPQDRILFGDPNNIPIQALDFLPRCKQLYFHGAGYCNASYTTPCFFQDCRYCSVVKRI